jgi:hypothetical protein
MSFFRTAGKLPMHGADAQASAPTRSPAQPPKRPAQHIITLSDSDEDKDAPGAVGAPKRMAAAPSKPVAEPPHQANREVVTLSSDEDDEKGGAVPSLSATFSAQMTTALPPRLGDVAKTAQSRKEIRQACANQLLREQHFMAPEQARKQHAVWTAKEDGKRGRMLSVGQVAAARELLKAKIKTSALRDVDSFGAPWDAEERTLGEDAFDSLSRQPGRVPPRDDEQPPIPGGTKAGYQYDPPFSGASAMLRYKVMGTFPSGEEDELRWHDGYIIDAKMVIVEEAEEQQEASIKPMYTVFWPIDGTTEPIEAWKLPHKGFCFRKPHLPNARASDEEMKRARAAIAGQKRKEAMTREEEDAEEAEREAEDAEREGREAERDGHEADSEAEEE